MHVQLIPILLSALVTGKSYAQSTPNIDEANQKCATEARSFQSSPCFSTLQTDLRKLVMDTETTDDLYTLSKKIITHTCAAEPCSDLTWRQSTSGLVDTCTPSVSNLWSNAKSEPVSQRIVSGIQVVGKSAFSFFKDFVCLKDTGKPNPCTSAWLDLAKKSNLVSMNTIDQYAGSDTAKRENVVQFMQQVGITDLQSVMIPVINQQALKDMNPSDLCTPCTRVLLSQLSSFVYKTVFPLWNDLDTDDANGMKEFIDRMVKAVNYKCNDSTFVTTNADIVFGSNTPIKTIDQVPNHTSGTAGTRRVPSPALYMILCVFVVSYMLT